MLHPCAATASAKTGVSWRAACRNWNAISTRITSYNVCYTKLLRLRQEAIEAEPGAVRQLAFAANGSMRDALSLLDQAIAFGGGDLLEAEVRSASASASYNFV